MVDGGCHPTFQVRVKYPENELLLCDSNQKIIQYYEHEIYVNNEIIGMWQSCCYQTTKL